MKAIQYTLWTNCNTNCCFCTHHNITQSDLVSNACYILDKVCDKHEVLQYDVIGLIGGEFFQNQLDNKIVYQKFYQIIDQCIYYIINHNKLLWLSTSLIFNPSRLIECLHCIQNKTSLDRILLCTSWDSVYRFTAKSEQLWYNNVNLLHKIFPDLKIHVETILTEDFMNKCINNQFNIDMFKDEYNVSLDFIEPHIGFQTFEHFKTNLPLFLPQRKTFLKFVNDIIKNQNLNDQRNFLNYKIRSNVCYGFEDGVRKKYVDRCNTELTTQSNIKKVGYCDSDNSMIKDAQILLNYINT